MKYPPPGFFLGGHPKIFSNKKIDKPSSQGLEALWNSSGLQALWSSSPEATRHTSAFFVDQGCKAYNMGFFIDSFLHSRSLTSAAEKKVTFPNLESSFGTIIF